MDLENNIRPLVEQILAQIIQERSLVSEGGKDALNTSQADEDLADISLVDLKKHLQVPNPVSKELYEEIKKATPARIGVWRCGLRPLTDTYLRFRADHAAAQDAVLNEVAEDFPAKFKMVAVKTRCETKKEYLTRPDLGRQLDAESLNILRSACKKEPQVQIIVADGLSGKAVEVNISNLLPALSDGLTSMGIEVGTIIFVKFARVAIMDVIGEELNPQAAIVLIGERPGLGTAESLSAYLGCNPRKGMLESERKVISNIHRGGTPAAEAGAHLATLLKEILGK